MSWGHIPRHKIKQARKKSAPVQKVTREQLEADIEKFLAAGKEVKKEPIHIRETEKLTPRQLEGLGKR